VFVRGVLDGLRNKLLDLAKSNRLVNFRHPESSRAFVRVIDELPDVLFRRLVDGRMIFKALPAIEETPADEKTHDFQIELRNARLTDDLYVAAIRAVREGDRSSEEVEKIERELRDRVRAKLGLPVLSSRGRPDLVNHAKAHNINPSYDLPEPQGALAREHDDRFIQTLLLPRLCSVVYAAFMTTPEPGSRKLESTLFVLHSASSNGSRTRPP
jgi:hypothetical protein